MKSHSAMETRHKKQIDDTLKRGNPLGTIRHFWLKTVESEERLKWINKMDNLGSKVYGN